MCNGLKPEYVTGELKRLARIEKAVDGLIATAAGITFLTAAVFYLAIISFALDNNGAATTACGAFGTLGTAIGAWLVRVFKRRRKKRRQRAEEGQTS
ncbi:hypothetical protein [Streptomyces sp. V1I6]|uniref:hypothetical protein n=1 Tax=Streptomyces sp. V1I6 TaxID=3042273 RepID=UPI002788DC3E|nr:hypothetical protein [Streptomyces sp. V1I6]MDQ0847986.1 hypothetical protein [Streptomyces sp. V1I6]